jgi:predicted RNA binding protein YcfA (HicA-like mRNA interferase family)
MGIKQIPISKFIKYLESLGLVYIRTSASHDYYNYPAGHPNGSLLRPVTIRTKYKDIPLAHIHTNLITLGISKKQFELDITKF